jgi:hypothetical protein
LLIASFIISSPLYAPLAPCLLASVPLECRRPAQVIVLDITGQPMGKLRPRTTLHILLRGHAYLN